MPVERLMTRLRPTCREDALIKVKVVCRVQGSVIRPPVVRAPRAFGARAAFAFEDCPRTLRTYPAYLQHRHLAPPLCNFRIHASNAVRVKATRRPMRKKGMG